MFHGESRTEQEMDRIEELYITFSARDGRGGGRCDHGPSRDKEARYEIWWSRGIGDRIQIWKPENGVGMEGYTACRAALRQARGQGPLRSEFEAKIRKAEEELQQHYERQWEEERKSREASQRRYEAKHERIRRIIDGNDGSIIFELAEQYEKGEATARCRSDAIRLYSRAALLGEPGAKEAAERLRQEEEEEEKNDRDLYDSWNDVWTCWSNLSEEERKEVDELGDESGFLEVEAALKSCPWLEHDDYGGNPFRNEEEDE